MLTQSLGVMLALPSLRQAQWLTPEQHALPRPVTGVSVIEVPVEQFVRRGELVLSTGIGVGQDETLLGRFVEDVAASGACALIVSVGPHTPHMPPSVIARAWKCDLPLLTLPWAIRFSDVIGDVLRRLIEEQGVLRLRDDLVWSLANGTLASEAWVLAQGKRFGFDLTRPHFALVGQRDPQDHLDLSEGDAARRVLEVVLGRLAQGGRAAFGAPAGESVALFVQGDGQDPARPVEGLLRPEGDSRLAAWSWGASVGVRGTHQFQQAYSEARVALRVGRSVRGPGRVTFPSEVLGGLVLLEAAGSPGARELQDQVERALSGPGSRHGVAWRTLEVYLETGGNVSETARRLGLHRQSLLHRLDRLQEALGRDLRNPEDRFTLELAVRLRRITHLAGSEA